MGTREVYEQKLKSGTGICIMILLSNQASAPLDAPAVSLCWIFTRVWANGPSLLYVLHDATAVAGSGIGGMLSAIHGFNTGIAYLQNHLKGPKWLPFLVGLPPLLLFSGASAAFGGYVLPKFAQLTVTSYYATSSASHYRISLLTRHVEEIHTSRSQQERLR